MTDEELKEAIDGLCAYDLGCTDSGICDERLRKRVIEELKKDIGLKRVSRIVRDMYLSDDAIESGYTIEDVAEIAEWIADLMR